MFENPNLFFQQLANGLAIGSVYAIFALGYTLVFSVLGIINFAHGAVFTLGAYFTYTLLGSPFGFNGLLAQQKLPFGLPFPLAMLAGAILAGLVAVLIERLAFRPLRRRQADNLLTLVSSLGVAVAVVNIIQFLVGAEAYSYPSTTLNQILAPLSFLFPDDKPPLALQVPITQPPVVIRMVQVVIFIGSILILAALTYLINGTKVGKALRAVAEDPTTSSLLGISTDRLILFTFFLSGFVGGIAGTLVGLSVGITGPYFGIAFGLKGLAVIVLGGLGSIPGAVAGGIVIGLGEALVPAQYNGYKDAVAFAVLFLVLILRPQGLLGRTVVQKV